MSTWIKVCGLTCAEDVAACVQLGVHAIGFNFYPKSPRFISPAEARRLAALLPPSVEAVGVFVNADRDEIAATASEAGLSTIQLHGDEPGSLCDGWDSLRSIQVLRPRTAEELRDVLGDVRAERVLLDAFSEHVYGGSGKRIDADLLSLAVEATPRPLIVSGGLHAENVQEVVAHYRPYGVDVASGVEERPGVKDHLKLERFCAAVRGAE